MTAQNFGGSAAKAAPRPASSAAQPPTISDVFVTNIKFDGATIQWRIEGSEDAVSAVEYGYGSNLRRSPESKGTGAFALDLKGLRSDTEYTFRVVARVGDVANDQASQFRTARAPAQPRQDYGGGGGGSSSGSGPSISSVEVSSVTDASANVAWRVDAASSATSFVEYGTSPTYGSTSNSMQGTGPRAASLYGLQPDTQYYIRVRARDAAGAESTGGEQSFRTAARPSSPPPPPPPPPTSPSTPPPPPPPTDTTPPVISGISVAEAGVDYARVVWGVADASAVQSFVEYGLTTAYGTQTGTLSGAGAKQIVLSGLAASTTYHFRVVATDAATNQAASPDATLATTGTLAINNVVEDPSDGSAKVEFSIFGFGGVGTIFEYGRTTGYGTTINLGTGPGAKNVFMGFLDGGKTYYYRITATQGTETVVHADTFTTDVSPIPWATGAGIRLQPGALIEICTLAFILRDATNETIYATTAGHCVPAGVGSAALDGAGAEFGTVVLHRNDNVGRDYALIQINEAYRPFVAAAVAYFTGPTGVATDDDMNTGDVICHHGYGTGFGTFAQTRRRCGVFGGLNQNADALRSVSYSSPTVWGDSGSALIDKDTGKALGIITHIDPPVIAETFITYGTHAATMFEDVLALARASGYDIQLATSPYNPPLVPPV